MGAFSIFSDKKKKAEANNGTRYRRLGTITTISKLGCLLLLLVIVLVGFSFHTDEINMDNFKYLANALTGDSVQVVQYKSLYYDNSEHNRFALVRGDLAVINNSGSTVYSLSGERKSADAALKMDDPQVLSSAKFIYVYDLGGTELVIKNALETVKTIRYSYGIKGVSVTDSGYIAVASSEKTTRSTVFVYDDKYREVYKLSFGSQYTLAIDVNENANRLVTASITANNGIFVTELGLYSLTQKEPLKIMAFEGEYPYRAVFNENGGFMLLTDKAIRFFDESGEETAHTEFGISGIDSYYINDGYFIRMYSDAAMTAEEKLELYDGNSGKLIYSKAYPRGIRLARCYDKYLFVVSDGMLNAVRLEDEELRTAAAGSDVLELIPLEEDNLLVLTHGTGDVINCMELFVKGEEVSEQ